MALQSAYIGKIRGKQICHLLPQIKLGVNIIRLNRVKKLNLLLDRL